MPRRWAFLLAPLVTIAIGLTWFAMAKGCGSLTGAIAETWFLPSQGARACEHRVRTTRDNIMITSDGVSLSADVHRPVGLETTPTILTRIPFNDTFHNRVRSHTIGRFWARRGYTVVVQGARGRYLSGGDFYPGVHERRDGLETLAWLKEQPWYDGRLVMWGGSAFGHTQWAVADQSEVDAFAIAITSTNYFETFHPGGAFALESALYWGLVSPPEADRFTSGEEIQSGADGWPVVEADDRALQDVPFYNDWATQRSRAPYWPRIDGDDRAMTAQAPILFLGGWYDAYTPTLLDDFTTVTTQNPHPGARESRLIIGPYRHAGEIEWPGGGIDEPYRAASVDPALPWFDHWLAVTDGPLAQPKVRLYVLGANEWRDYDEWPPKGATPTRFHLQPDGGLSPSAPVGEGTRAYVYDPEDPVPTRGGAMLGPRAGVERQAAVSARDDVVSFVSEPLDADLEVIGPITARLHVATDAPTTDFTVKLMDVHPDGAAYNIADGVVRQAYVPGEVTAIEVRLDPTAIAFKAGHRLRVDVSSSNFPRFDRNPNTGEDPATATTSRPANQTLHLSATAPSYVVLPVMDAPPGPSGAR